MNFKALIRTLIFLIILFAMLYVGMNNTETIDFSFPGVLAQKIQKPAALIFFGIFAVGVLGGTLLHTGGGGSRRSSSKEK